MNYNISLSGKKMRRLMYFLGSAKTLHNHLGETETAEAADKLREEIWQSFQNQREYKPVVGDEPHWDNNRTGSR